jgi:maleylpyruvate isomerase
MYASPEQRAADIERGASMSPDALTSWAQTSADDLEAASGELSDEQWTTEIVTAQGRTLPASEIPWLRAREVCVHLVDLDLGPGFADLPEEFLLALRADVLAKREAVPSVAAPLAAEVAWLTGRPHQLADAPPLPPWL